VVSAAKCVIDNLLDYSSVCSSELSAASTCPSMRVVL